MLTCFQQIGGIDDLREYVNATICNYNQLETGFFPMTERILMRRDKPCGVYFCVHGPRATKFSAIWELEGNQILFYGSGGERFQKIKLTDVPSLRLAAA